ncbi:pyridoxal-phosphate dependent enzyme [Steroidobacter cummioxidans]|uniref:pyridoxal-phosphate dependent enzyme n=1 Tax=Steroidobacter cummioxidans TaxID=1803913 RepID=UPI0019D4E415|nr:pyridoxal-phosphate dependent enzyme [Steroidobacter cummioxidans]
MTLTLADIRAAHTRIKDRIHRTPVMTSATLNEKAGAQLFFKCENLQKIGAFKARGATNAVSLLSEEEAKRGVVTHSSGNHAAALARAAKLRGIPAYIVMPSNSPQAKVASVRRFGAEVISCEPTLAARESAANSVVERTGATFIHPYNDLRVMAGQGTTALELLEDVPDLTDILCPVGGGGLLSGVSTAIKSINPEIHVFGVEPQGADDAARSLAAGKIIPCTAPNTIADGLRTSLGELTFDQIQRHVDGIVTVSETEIVHAMRTIWEVLKIIVEPSGAVGYGALVDGQLDMPGRRVGIILTGGNLDLDTLPWMTPAKA